MTAKYQAKAYDNINLRVKKGKKAELKTFVASRGESLNGFITKAIEERVEREQSKRRY